MKYYMAPLEGITGYVFRNVHHRYFPGTDKYFIPFIEPKPNSKKIFSSRELNDILPEHNMGMAAVPQILTGKWQDFVWTAGHLKEYGYQEVNLNLGCPSRTVVSKGRGSGLLAYPEKVDEFLYQIFEKLDMKISVKTRLGIEEPEEFEQLLEIYNKYPLEELIIHPRTQKDFYKGIPRWEAFGKAAEATKLSLCYNGDINSQEDFEKLKEQFAGVEAVMVGRGVLKDPALIRELQGGPPAERKELRSYHDDLLEGYRREMCGETNVLFKMKEIWCYLNHSFGDLGKLGKTLRKTKGLEEYEMVVNRIFEEGRREDE